MPEDSQTELSTQVTQEAADELRRSAATAAMPWQLLQRPATAGEWKRGWLRVEAQIEQLLRELRAWSPKGKPSSEAEASARTWLKDNPRLVHSAALEISGAEREFRRVAYVRVGAASAASEEQPRVLVLARAFLDAVGNAWSEESFHVYFLEFQQHEPITVRELSVLPTALRQVMLGRLLSPARKLIAGKASAEDAAIVPLMMRGLQATGVAGWRVLLEPLTAFDTILRRDPVYDAMDYDSREYYSKVIARLADHSPMSESAIARAALEMAQAVQAHPQADSSSDDRLTARRAHVGYYLIDDGRPAFYQKIGFRPPWADKIRSFIRRYADDFFVGGIQIVTLLLITVFLVPLISGLSPFIGLLWAFLFTLIPASQSAVELMNYLVTGIFEANPLPKVDLANGIPDDAATLVAIPSILLNQEQTIDLIKQIEVRYLANRDKNLHFVLLTDLPDSVDRPREQDRHPLVDLAAQLIDDLNLRHTNSGSFLFLHRHRVFNPRQGVWMGWERKRGKLLDLNKLLRGSYDSFPVKAGDLSVLPKIRYVLTLDADTQLPRGSAARLIGTILHPLNRAIIDPMQRIVHTGYGILQPRVGVSVQSAARSRLANIYSGQTGLDIYSKAVSDVYQDLYGEGIFTGKGLYEVDVLQAVLDRRFPRDSLLSHDLIEGSYARVGLVTDVEVIDDYPSHVSAYNRRKHRWVRGDWQIVQWLFSRVPDESGRTVINPISTTSRWKILDNLRRSLVEPATFALLIAGWLLLPGGPLYWTLITMLLLFLPIYEQLFFALIRAFASPVRGMVSDAFEGFYANHIMVGLSIAFLPYQTLISIDAIGRTLIRRFITGQQLLEWETAAEAESGGRINAVDRYLKVVPLLALAIAVLIGLLDLHALIIAAPILILWAVSGQISNWLNQPPREGMEELTAHDVDFLRQALLRTWRYFRQFSTEQNNWLIPDNVEEKNLFVAERVSPTNLGLLINSRQVAFEAGYLTLPEFVMLSQSTLNTLERMHKHYGHLLNWYDTATLEPFDPGIVSSVDSGNLVASLWTFRMGCLELLNRPVIQKQLYRGFADHLRLLEQLGASGRRDAGSFAGEQANTDWVQVLLAQTLPQEALSEDRETLDEDASPLSDLLWWRTEAQLRIASFLQTIGSCLPWLLPEFAPVRAMDELQLNTLNAIEITPKSAVRFMDELDRKLQERGALLASGDSNKNQQAMLMEKLRSLLPDARQQVHALCEQLTSLAKHSAQLADAMSFRTLLHRGRNLLSVALRTNKAKVDEACYDLLASEARMAVFLAVANEEIEQDVWFRLGRSHTLATGNPVLLSWTGTMFEYLMPPLWMRSYPGTLLDGSLHGAVEAQRQHVAALRIPWGISEAGYSAVDPEGHYQYFAFGVPALALSNEAKDGPVISPYSSFLAMPIERQSALKNLYRMQEAGWLGPFGFYEAADYSNIATQSSREPQPVLVRSWMAHHQGMTLLALANVLFEGAVQRWFHSDPRVQATELLLHEKPLRPSALVAMADANRKYGWGERKKAG